MTSETVPTIGFFVPSGVGIGYTGPGVFLKRLIGPLGDVVEARVYAGERPGHQTDPQLVPTRSMRVGESGPLRQLAWALTATAWIVRDRKRLDAVHFHGTYLYKIIPAVACAFFRIPYVLVPLAAHADFSLRGRATRIPGVRPLLRFIGRNAAGGFALGAEIAAELLEGGVPEQHIHTIMNPVSTGFFGEPAANRRDMLTVLFVGVIGKRKRPTLVLDALGILRDKHGIDSRAIFLGPFATSTDRVAFASRVSELHLEHVVEHVEFSDDVSGYMLNSSSIFVLLSETEGIPGALVEAMAAGLPSVVTDAGAMRDIITESDAGVVVAADSEDAAHAMSRLATDGHLWHAYSSRARAYAEKHFRAESIADTYLAQLRSAVSTGSRVSS
ncbi:glycosyltransferase family 4 protein [Microbacterium sp. NPDC087591]|uniref:glycosyltransferase family 4 protein n=1 Tax=Microbacterium sp. NPDC087591 TaxID=3364192 RepID=UPI0037FFC26C